jgi:hypothetical protein
MFDPAPPSVGGFPYTESNGILRINQAYSTIADEYPTGANFFVPLIEVVLDCPTEFNLASGPSGTTLLGQSFNETRGVDVTVGSACGGVEVASLTLQGLNLNTGEGIVGARIYDSDTAALITGAEVTVPPGVGLTVTIPLSASLSVGESYRIAFFVDGGIGGSGTVFDPDPVSVGGFPYVEATGVMTIHQAYSNPSDAFPTTPITAVSLIRINTAASAVDVPVRMIDVAGVTGVSFSGPRPNPFASSMRIQFSLARAGLIDLSVHDVSGRLVNRQDLGLVGAGDHAWTWDGSDLAGESAAAGVYFIRLDVGGVVAGTRKAVLLR